MPRGLRLRIGKGDYGQASSAVREALRIAPDYPPYLFEQGYIEYRRANYAHVASAFSLCVERSEVMLDGFYLDATRIAQALCLVLDGRADMAGWAILRRGCSAVYLQRH